MPGTDTLPNLQKSSAMFAATLRLLFAAVALLAPVAVAAAPADSYIVLNYHDIPENGSKRPPFDRMAVARRNFAEHLDWLADNGYHFISVQQIIDAHDGKAALPEKAVLLTFDDGYESFYTRVFPLLKERHIPAVLALIGTWMNRTEVPDVPGDKPVLTWPQVREIAASGLVEIASHTDDMHGEIAADPLGETHAAVTTRQYLERSRRYETDAEYARRLARGMARSRAFITAAIGQRPRVLVWPFGEYNALAVAAARRAGMPITLALSDGANVASGDLSVINRLLITDDPPLPAFAALVGNLGGERTPHTVRVNLDSIWSRSPRVEASREAAIIRRVQASGASAVYLQAYSDPDRNGAVDAMYFHNRHLPVRADLFGAMAERLKEASGARIYALMPAQLARAPAGASRMAGHWAGDIYEDLAKYNALDGVVLSNERLVYPARLAHEHRLELTRVQDALLARMKVYRPDLQAALDSEAAYHRAPARHAASPHLRHTQDAART